MTALTARARKLAAASGDDAVCEHTGEADPGLAYVRAFGEARNLLAELADRLERPGSEAEDTRRLAGIRDVLAGFDWEYHDRQLALEAIERIAEGGQA